MRPSQPLLSRLLSLFRVQVPLLILVAVLFPAALRYGVHGNYAQHVSLPNSLALSIAAVVGGAWLARKISAFPGTGRFIYIIPSYCFAFAAVLIVAFVGRLEYNRSLFVASFLMGSAAGYAITYLAARGQRRTYLIVPGGRVRKLKEIGNVDWVQLTKSEQPDHYEAEIVADLHFDHPPEWERWLAQAAIAGVPVYHVKQVRESLTGRVQIEHLSENTFGSLLPNLAYRKLKRLIDLAACIVLLPVFLVMMAVIALLIRLDSPGPIFFVQRRVGYRGVEFNMVKFRSMRPAAPEDGIDAAITRDGDTRVTRIGRVLRHYRLDELPQILNIIRGEMSWIGPRPEATQLSAWYESEIPFYAYRHIVRPGLTGWAQVNQGHVADIADIHHKLQYDFFYVKNFSAWLDMLIALRTAIVIASGFGSR